MSATRKWFPFAAILFFAACGIQVDDLGPYWNKGIIDPALAGTWVAEKDKSSEEGRFTNVGGMYRIEGIKDKRTNSTALFKTLQIGNYRFLMTGPRSTYTWLGPAPGVLFRYVVAGDRFYACNLRSAPIRNFLQNYPHDENFIPPRDCSRVKEGKTCYEYLEITRLNDEGIRMISEIPNDGTYWDCEELMRKISSCVAEACIVSQIRPGDKR